MRLTSDFKHQLPDYRIASFYVLRPTKPFSTLVGLTQTLELFLDLVKLTVILFR